MTCEVCVVGSLNFDQIAYVSKFPKPGETIYGKKFVTGFGGKGANQCVMAAKMGAKTAMVGALGSDDIARITLANMASCGVNTEGILQKEGVASGVAPITVGEDGQNSIIICPGANLELTPADVEAQKEVIQSSKVLLCQNEVPPRTTLAAMRVAKGGTGGPLVILNAAPAPSEGGKWEEGEWESIPEMVAACDVLCVSAPLRVNETEAERISGVSLEGAGELEGKLREAASKMLGMGAGSVLFTLGGEGSCLARRGAAGEGSGGGLEVTRVAGPARKVEVVDTSGAGDCFLGALAACLAAHCPLPEAMVKAGRVATMSVTRPGTQTSYPDLASLPDDLKP